METICMKCHSLFFGKNKKNIVSLLSAEIARVVQVNDFPTSLKNCSGGWAISIADVGSWHHENIKLTSLKSHFNIVKLGFAPVYNIFHISAQNIDCGYSSEMPRWSGSNEYPQSMFWAEIWKISEFLSENFQFLEVKFSMYLYRQVFVMRSGFESSWRGSSAHDYTALHSTEPFIISIPLSWEIRCHTHF